MPRNFKKLVAARREKTGESYATAAKHVRERMKEPDAADSSAAVDLLEGLRFIASQPRWTVVEPSWLYKEGDMPLTEHERVDIYKCRGCGCDLPIRGWTDDSPKAEFFTRPDYSGFVVVCQSCFDRRTTLSPTDAAALIKKAAGRSD